MIGLTVHKHVRPSQVMLIMTSDLVVLYYVHLLMQY